MQYTFRCTFCICSGVPLSCALLQLGLSWNLIALAVLSGQLTDAQREVSSPLSTAALNEQHMAEILDKFKAEKSNEKQMEVCFSTIEPYSM